MSCTSPNFSFPVAGLEPKAGLLGKTPEDAALVDQWISFIDAEILANFSVALKITRATDVPYSKPVRPLILLIKLFLKMLLVDRYLLPSASLSSLRHPG